MATAIAFSRQNYASSRVVKVIVVAFVLQPKGLLCKTDFFFLS